MIHQTAIVDSEARLHPTVKVGPYSIIRGPVEIGEGTEVGPHVVIEGNTIIGKFNRIFQFASIGSAPQDLKFKGEPSRLEIGDRNLIREYVTIQPGTEGGGMVTRIGSGNLFMANSHVGHDARIGDRNVFANSVALGGHVVIGNGAILGGLSGVHQFCRVGDLSLLAGGSMVSKDVPPYCLVHGDRARAIGLNEIGLKRAELDPGDLKKVYRKVFFGKGPLQDRLKKIREEFDLTPLIEKFLSFIESSERGIISR